MSDPDNFPIGSSISTLKNEVKQGLFMILDVTAQGVATQIRHLHHAGEFTVHK